jgi:O-antigen/teichoic acid export membrane protein
MLGNVLSNWLGLLITGIVSFVLTPVLIHGLGNFYYGMWVLVASIVDYYGLLDLGMRWSMFRFVARFKGADERVALNEMFATALATVCSIASALVVLTILLMPLLPRFFAVAGSERHLFEMLILLMGISIAVSLVVQLLGAYLRGLQRFDLYNLSAVSASILRAVLIILILRAGYGIVAVAVATLSITVLSLILNIILVRSADPGTTISLKMTNWHRMKDLTSYSFYSFVSSTGEYLRFYTDSAVIGRVLTIALITPFSIASRLMEYFKSVLGAVNGPVMARMSELDGQERHEELRSFFLSSTRLTMMITLFVASLLLLDGKVLIHLWVGPGFDVAYTVAVILLAGYIASFGQQPCMLIIFARAKHHRALSWWTLAEGLANVILSVYWARRYGLLGVAWGTTIPLLISKTIIQPWYALRLARVQAWQYVREGLLRPLTACTIVLIPSWMFLRPVAESGYFEFGVKVFCHCACLGLLAWILGLVSSERKALVDRGRHFVALLPFLRAGG